MFGRPPSPLPPPGCSLRVDLEKRNFWGLTQKPGRATRTTDDTKADPEERELHEIPVAVRPCKRQMVYIARICRLRSCFQCSDRCKRKRATSRHLAPIPRCPISAAEVVTHVHHSSRHCVRQTRGRVCEWIRTDRLRTHSTAGKPGWNRRRSRRSPRPGPTRVSPQSCG